MNKKLSAYFSRFVESLKHPRTIDLILLLLLGLIPLFWFKASLIDGGDLEIPLNPGDALNRRLYVWDERMFAGYDGSQFIPFLFPYYLFFALFNGLGLALTVTEKIWFVFVFALPGLTMYYLVSTLVVGERRRPASVVSAIFYMFNPYTLIQWHDGHQILLLIYAILPAILALYVKGLSVKKNSCRYAVLIGFASLLFASSGSNIPIVITTGFMLLIYFLFHTANLRADKREVLHALKFSAVTAGIVFLFNAWWTLLIINYSLNFSEIVFERSINWSDIASQATFPDFFRMLGFWGWYIGYKGEPYYSFAHYYSSNLLLIGVSFSLPIIAYVALFFRLKGRHVFYFAILSIIGTFFAKGINAPFGEAYAWLYLNFPGFFIFRGPYNKFAGIVAFAYAFLLGITSSEVYRKLRGISLKNDPHSTEFFRFTRKFISIAPKAFALAFMILILVNSWPLLTGDVIESKREILPTFQVEIPSYYYDASNWLNEQRDYFRIFVLPYSPQGYVKYLWGYGGADITPRIFTKPQISTWAGSFPSQRMELLTNFLYTSFSHNISQYMGKLLGLMNVRYVLQRNDIDWTFYLGVDSPDKIRSVLNSQKGIVLERTFEDLEFYRINYSLPHIYATSNTILLQGNFSEMARVIEREDFALGNAVIFLSEQLNPQQDSFLRKQSASKQTKPPEIEVERINPTEYVVRVHAVEPFFLVFNDSYHQDWKAYVDDEEQPHFLANYNTNGYFISKTGEYEVALKFTLQKVFQFGVLISSVTSVACLVYLLGIKTKLRQKLASISRRSLSI